MTGWWLATFSPERSPEQGRCQAADNGVWCPAPVSVWLTVGCEHEHVRLDGMCPEHAGRTRAYVAEHGAAMCTGCGHVCRLGIARTEPVR